MNTLRVSPFLEEFSKYQHIMVDLETLGTEPSSVILSIGAVNFDAEGLRGTEFYKEIKLDEHCKRTLSVDTLKWWIDRVAEGNPPPPVHGATGIITALYGFFYFYQDIPGKKLIWTNGTDFDISILVHAFIQEEIAIPWAYNAVRDFRTIKNLFGMYGIKPENPNSHNALSDAKCQAEHLVSIVKNLSEFI